MGKRTLAIALVLIALGAAACDDDAQALLVDLKTDYVSGEEFSRIRTSLFTALPASGMPLAVEERAAEVGEDFIMGVRIAELTLVGEGTAVLHTELLGDDGTVLATRVSRVTLSGNATGVTVLISRDCAGVTCPSTGNTECFGGVCVSPDCVEEVPASCGPTICMSDADCTSPIACAEGRCVAGACLTEGLAARCAVDEYCDPEVGCLPSASSTCPSGSADCNRDRADGCEADLAAPASCGDCLTVCEPGLGCASGGCEERVAWSHTSGDVDFDSAYAVAFEPGGRLLVSGSFRGTVDLFQGGSRTATTMTGTIGAVYIAALTAATGEHQWDNVYQGSNIFGSHDIVVTAGSTVLFHAQHEADLDFGGGIVPVVGAASGWVLALDSTDGSWRWNHRVEDQTGAIAVAPDGSSFTLTRFVGSDDFGGGTRTNPGDITSIITALDPSGGYLWDQILGGVGPDLGSDIVYAPDGRLFACGRFQQTVDFGGGDRTSADPTEFDGYILGLGTDGSYVWDQQLSAMGRVIAIRMKLAPDGTLRVIGFYADGTDFGGGPRASASFGGFLMALTTDGTYLWDRTIDATSALVLVDLAISADGRMWLAGYAEGDYDLGDAPRTSAGLDAFVLALEADGTTRWARVFAGTGADHANRIAIGDGMVFVTGDYDGDIDFGLGTRSSSGMVDAFLLGLRDDLAR